MICTANSFTQGQLLCFVYFVFSSFSCSCYVVSSSASDWMERLVSKMTYNVLMGMLNPTHSLTHLWVSEYIMNILCSLYIFLVALAMHDIFHTPMARYSLFVLKMPLNTQVINSLLTSTRYFIMYRWGEDVDAAATARCSASPWQLDHPPWPEGFQPAAQPQGHS